METQINKVCSSAFYYLHNLRIRRIRKYLSQDCLVTLIHAFVTGRLGYCNSLMYGLPQCQIQNYREYKTLLLALLLTSVKRIQFKILLLTFKAIHGLSPPYISELTTVKPNLSSNNSSLLLPPTQRMLPTFASRSFAAAAPALWNKLPAYIRNIASLKSFKKSIKIFLLTNHFNFNFLPFIHSISYLK